MKNETDLESVKAIARSFLMLEPEETEFSPAIIKHPFTDSGIVVSPRNNDGFLPLILTRDSKALLDWRQAVRERIDEADSAYRLYFMITKPYCLAFLKYAEPYLSREDFSEILAAAWVRTEAPNADPNLTKNKLLSMFKKADPSILMDEDEYEQLKALDETVTVYRGVTSHNAKNIKALSWTLDFETAEWFAHRFNEDGTVYEARIDKEHIYALFNGRKESEVIVDPKFLREITETQSMEDGFSITQ